VIRIYEAPDVMLLSQWSPQHELNCKMPLSSIAWNSSRAHPPMLAVGSDDQNEICGKVILFQFFENSRKWDKVISIDSIVDPVHDIAFAPNIGRSFHLLGVASKEVRILSIKENKSQQNITDLMNNEKQVTQPQQKYDVETKCCFNDHGKKVWRVSWNITGTILASSGDDGYVRLWKANYLGNWKAITQLKIDKENEDQILITPSVINSSQLPVDLNTELNPNGQGVKYYKFGNINNANIPLH